MFQQRDAKRQRKHGAAPANEENLSKAEYLIMDQLTACPVTNCSATLTQHYAERKIDHWISIHSMFSPIYFCSECYFVTRWPSYLKQHYEMYHGYNSLTVVNAMPGSRCVEMKVKENYYIDPIFYRVEEAETGSGEDTTVFINLTHLFRVKCPVPNCGGVKFKMDIYSALRNIRMHWQNYHVPLTQYFKCGECAYVTDHINFLKHLKVHGYNQVSKILALQNSKIWEQKNESFIDPGVHRFPWRTLYI